MSKVENNNGVFPSRLRRLLTEKGDTITALARELGLSRQAVSLYVDGTNTPNADKLCAIADYFNVSTDWLLGRTETRSPSMELQAAVRYTNLSENATEILHQLGSASIMESGDRVAVTRMLSDLIESSRFFNMFSGLGRACIYNRACDYDDRDTDTDSLTDEEFIKLRSKAQARGLEVLRRNDLKELMLQRTVDVFNEICKEIVAREKEGADNG